MQLIPLTATPNQTLSVQLGTTNYEIQVFQNTTGVYLTLSQKGTVLVASVRCHDRVRIVRDAYIGFSGDLTFFDTQGVSDPDYTGFGERFVLGWLEP